VGRRGPTVCPYVIGLCTYLHLYKQSECYKFKIQEPSQLSRYLYLVGYVHTEHTRPRKPLRKQEPSHIHHMSITTSSIYRIMLAQNHSNLRQLSYIFFS
jgi:hypothetical protein